MFFQRHIYFCIATTVLVSLGAHAANIPPQVTNPIPAANLYAGAPAKVITLLNFFTDPDTIEVSLTTTLGTMNIALYSAATPITVANFLNYVDSGRYDPIDPTTGKPAPIFFHRSVPGFVIQSGGYADTVNPSDPQEAQATQVVAFPAIQNEPGISNLRGTIAMAKLPNEPNSATSEWYINLADNSASLDTQDGGFTVFGRVLGTGMTVADAIAAQPIFNFGSPFDSLPAINYTMTEFNQGQPLAPGNLITIPSIVRVPALTFTASSDHPAFATVTISDGNLLVSGQAVGTANITVTATDVDGASVSQTFPVTITSAPPHLANISTRIVVSPTNDLIGGFIVRGDSPKRVAIRALGPSLGALGLTNVLANPTLTLFNSSQAVIASNDDWQNGVNAQQVIDAGLAPTQPNESVILTTLPANDVGIGYTAVVQGVGGTGGIGVVEVYDLDSGPSSNVLNISTRGFVQTGNDIMIGGFIVSGDASQTVLVRAIGPSLTGAGITNALADPTLSLVNSDGMQIDFNDNWQSSPDEAAIEASTLAPSNPKESAVLQTLAPGGYTALVQGVNASTGTAVVEVYALPSS